MVTRDIQAKMGHADHKVRVFGVDVDVVTLDHAVEKILEFLAGGEHAAVAEHARLSRVVVTPNLDHAVMLRSNEQLRRAYARADLVVADGMPLIWASNLMGTPLPERVAGSDLVPALFKRGPLGLRVFLLGASDESSRRCAERLGEEYPKILVVGRLSPPKGFEHSDQWSATIVDAITRTKAQVVVVAFGAPKQELWVDVHRDRLPGVVLLCAGATIDFLGGTIERAPPWTRSLGLEWLHRLSKDPARLIKRYAKDAVWLPLLLANDAVHRIRLQHQVKVGAERKS